MLAIASAIAVGCWASRTLARRRFILRVIAAAAVFAAIFCACGFIGWFGAREGWFQAWTTELSGIIGAQCLAIAGARRVPGVRRHHVVLGESLFGAVLALVIDPGDAESLCGMIAVGAMAATITLVPGIAIAHLRGPQPVVPPPPALPVARAQPGRGNRWASRASTSAWTWPFDATRPERHARSGRS